MPRVILACDPGERRDAVQASLVAAAMQVTLSGHAEDAAHLARSLHADALVLLDAPGCDALLITQALRHDTALHACMIVTVALRDRHAALMRAGADHAMGSGTTADEVAEAVLGRLQRRDQLLDVGAADARRRSADSMVEAIAGRGSLRGVIALRVERMPELAAALGNDGALMLRGQLRERLSPLLPRGSELTMIDGGAIAALDSATASIPDVAESLLREARQALRANGRELRLRVHAGYIECKDAAALDAPTALRRAEAAAREARHQGLSAPHAWCDELGARLLGDVELASAMRQAVEQADFRLVFQPQVRMDRAEPFGVEALIRWNLPGGVSVPPNQFVALAEESGLIEDIGAWSLREACRTAVAWEEQGLRLRVAVNIAPRQAMQPHFAETVRQALAESGFAGDRLLLELTEAAMLRGAETLSRSLETIRSLGVQVAVDDFGAGLATLAGLRGLPISEIKIDRSFVRPLPGLPEDRLAVETILRLAQQMQLRTLAVGVENAAQWAWLKEQGCDAAQGWLIGKPVEGAELPGAIGALRRARGQFAVDAANA
jgi:EAL domain-containing protein (putative c-di-GMP-specific phosphodiesterase class I)/DNA-binding response OmpR family regulator